MLTPRTDRYRPAPGTPARLAGPSVHRTHLRNSLFQQGREQSTSSPTVDCRGPRGLSFGLPVMLSCVPDDTPSRSECPHPLPQSAAVTRHYRAPLENRPTFRASRPRLEARRLFPAPCVWGAADAGSRQDASTQDTGLGAGGGRGPHVLSATPPRPLARALSLVLLSDDLTRLSTLWQSTQICTVIIILNCLL